MSENSAVESVRLCSEGVTIQTTNGCKLADSIIYRSVCPGHHMDPDRSPYFCEVLE